MRLMPTLGATIFLATAGLADAAVIDKTSPHDVATTIDRLEQAVEAAGASVIARVDHAGAAEGAGLELRPTQLLIFGNPEVGTPLMQENQALGLELPLRVAAFEDADGSVHLIYEDPAQLAAAYGLDAESQAVTDVSAALERLTDMAVAED